MRVVRTRQYKLIQNINYKAPFPIDLDFAVSATFLDLLNRTESGQPTHWFSTLQKYYYREQFELFDLQNDPHELHNLHNQTQYAPVMRDLIKLLKKWQEVTNDPWICDPYGVLTHDGKCHRLDNGVPKPDALRHEL